MAYHYGNKFRLSHGHRSGGKPTPTYQTWIDMRRRCNNKSHPAYKWYGARGIKVCESWSMFKAFLDDMGAKPSGMSLERIDNGGDYAPHNCKWATAAEQAANNRGNRKVEFNGKYQTISEWSRVTGIGKTTIRERLQRGWPASKALTTRVR